MEMGILRWGLVIYAIASAVLIFLLWRSPGADNAFSQVGALFGGLALAFVAISPALRQDERHSLTTLALFRDADRNALLFGPFMGPYERQFELTIGKFMRAGPYGMEVEVSPEKEIEFVEYAIVQTLLNQMRGVWTSQVIETPMVHGRGNRGQSFLGDTSEKEKWSADRLKAAMRANAYIASYGLVYDETYFPPGMTIELKDQGQLGSTISLRVDDFEINIAIGGLSSGTINEDIWGIFKLDHDFNKPLRFGMSSYTLLVQGKTAKLNRYPRLIRDYWIWYEKTAAAIARLDWSKTDRELLDEHTRALLWKGGPTMFERARQQAGQGAASAPQTPP